MDIASARRLARAYREAGGRAVLTGPESFSMIFATALNPSEYRPRRRSVPP